MKERKPIMNDAEQKYCNDILLAFPQLINEIDMEEGIHYNMESFAQYTIQQIRNSNFEELKKCFAFQEEKIPLVTPEIENAMNVSYCESMLLSDVGPNMLRVTKYMGRKLFTMYKDYEDYYNQLSKHFK